MALEPQPPTVKALAQAKDAWHVRLRHNSEAIDLLAGIAPAVTAEGIDLALAAFLLGLGMLPAEAAWCVQSGEFEPEAESLIGEDQDG